MSAESRPSPWTPLRVAAFRTIWIATVASNIGTWMHDTAATWLMTTLSPSTLVVALMQTATSLPVLFLALPAGALADVVDRRKLLLVTQSWMLGAAALLAGLTIAGAMTPARLLVLTFILGIGSALNIPAWQATTADLVPRTLLAPAVALTGVATNIARAVGPAIGGLVIAISGPWAVFALNATSFLAVIIALARWTPPQKTSSLPAERVLGAMRAGARYVGHNPALQTALLRTATFIAGASALWALLPVVARRQLSLGAAGYGILLGSLGIGAVAGGVVLPRLRRRYSSDQLVLAATVAFATASAMAATVHVAAIVGAGLAVAGAAWMTAMPIFNVAVQSTAADWARARALAVYIIAFQGLMAIGGAVWGTVATHLGVPAALLSAATVLVLGGAVMYRQLPLVRWERVDVRPSDHWREPVVTHDQGIHDDAGPVAVTVEYHVREHQASDFAVVMRDVARLRRRDGAFAWTLYRDTADPERYIEMFMSETWGEHLRQHARATIADQELEARARVYHVDSEPPVVRHMIAVDEARQTTLWSPFVRTDS